MIFLPDATYKTCLALSLVFSGACITPSYAQESGTWKDPKTGLIWQRCSLGQTSNGYDCDGEPTSYTWEDAQQAANAIGKGWRVPAASELMSLVRCNTGFQKTTSLPDRKGGKKRMPSLCNEGASRPTIDTTIFPNTPDHYYWSSSPETYISGNVWLVGFGYGNDFSYSKLNYGLVRLVRSSQ